MESLTGDGLHHWSELTDNGQRQIVLHLKGKTIVAQAFSLTLAGTAPTEATQWSIPRFELNKSTRQSGDLVVQPILAFDCGPSPDKTSLKRILAHWVLRDEEACAFRLLQRDWSLQLGIQNLLRG